MSGLSPALSRQLQDTLLSCGPFASAGELQSVFSDGRIAAWRHRLPESNNAAGRVMATVDFLYHKRNERGENGLALFLQALAERIPPGDQCRRDLAALAEAVATSTRQTGDDTPALAPGVGGGTRATIPVELREKVRTGEFAIFAGHGLSEAAGLPSRAKLAQALAARLGEEVSAEAYDDGQALPDIAQLYEVARGRHALLSYLRDALDTTGSQPAPLHRIIARLPLEVIVATTYDNLLEQAMREAGRRINKVMSDSTLPHGGSGRVQLLKLKGDVERPESVVITRQDLERYAVHQPLIVNQLRDRLASTTFVLLGYESEDPDLKLLFEQSGHHKGNRRMHYALMTGVSPLQEQVFRTRQIRVLDIATEDLEEWLEDLASFATR